MWTLFIVIGDPRTDPLARFPPGFEGAQINAFVFQRPPETLDHTIIDPTAFAIHRYRHLSHLQFIDPVAAGELRSLIGVEDLRRAIFGKRLL